MNKTININLAGIFFHVDEDAYTKLQNYLEAVKRSFANEDGSDEILADIEARIAELFNERIQNERQVIGMNEVGEIIEIMGQPEDYNVDGETFDTEQETSKTTSKNKAPKQLFRDPLNSYAGGVSSGLGYYLGIDPVWVRLLWVLFTVFSSGAFILIYFALWIFVPKAETTSERLAMQGESINIDNIKRKFNEGFEEVSGKVKSSSPAFFESLGDILKFCIKLFVKAIGAFLILVSSLTIISLFIGIFGVTTFSFVDAPWGDVFIANSANTPSWKIMLCGLFVIGIPFFFLFILGLKIIFGKLKSIGRSTKLVLLALWIISLFALTFFTAKRAMSNASDAKITTTKTLQLTENDTLRVRMFENESYINELERNDDFEIRTNDNGEKVIVSQDIVLYIKSTNASNASIKITKFAEGSSYDEAKKHAEGIQYNYNITDNTLVFDGHALSKLEDKYRDQQVKITLSIPEGMTIYADESTYNFNSRSSNKSIVIRNKEEKYLKIYKDSISCDTCPNEDIIDNDIIEDEDFDGINIDVNANNNDRFNLKIDEHGIRINNEPVKIEINDEGINIESED